MLDVLFDNESINEKFNIYLAERPLIPIAEMEYETIFVPGRNGSLTRELGYGSKPIELKFNYISLRNNKQKQREIVNWLKGRSLFALSDDIYVYRRIQTMNFEDAINDLKQFVGFTIYLETEPFWYEDAGTTILNQNKNKVTIINPSREIAPCIIDIKGEGICSIKINDREIKITDVQDYVTIDGILRSAYKDDVSMDNNMEGKYPYLESGENAIEIGGDVESASIIKRWCWR